MDIKELIAKSIVLDENVEIKNLIVESATADKGDYCLPCFSLAKVMHKNPMEIANNIVANLKPNAIVDHVEVVAGYINFFLKKR